jgi:coenzyme F420-0:L-glutamate ligase
MELLPITTPLLRPQDSLSEILSVHATLQEGDIIVISSKVVATAEDRIFQLSDFPATPKAHRWYEETGGSRSPEFYEAVLQETKRMNGAIVNACPGAVLTEVRPEGLKTGSILTANAGLDESNTTKGTAIGWPGDPVASADRLRNELEKKIGGRVAIIITDSCCRPRRLGVTAFALTVSGLDPLVSQAGKEDLFGKQLRITTEAVADQLATAANFLMGNAGQSMPAVIIRGHGLLLSDFSGWVDGIEPEEDLFKGVLK